MHDRGVWGLLSGLGFRGVQTTPHFPIPHEPLVSPPGEKNKDHINSNQQKLNYSIKQLPNWPKHLLYHRGIKCKIIYMSMHDIIVLRMRAVSYSTIRRLNTFLRTSMNEERLSALALIHLHYEDVVDMDEAVDLFARLHARRLI